MVKNNAGKGCFENESCAGGARKYYVHPMDNAVLIRTGYNSQKDIVFIFALDGGNNLPDYRRVYLLPKDTDVNDFTTSDDVIIHDVGDMIGAYRISAVENVDGDTPENRYFTGGNHQTNNSYKGAAATAHNESFNVYVDGELLGDSNVFCDSVVLKWTNYIQAHNTTKSTGDGRAVLREDVEITMNGCRTELCIKNTALEKVERQRYYGLQLMNWSFVTIKYIGGKPDTEYSLLGGECSSSGNRIARSYIVKTKAGTSMEAGVYDVGLGNFEHCAEGVSSIFVANGKTYFSLINGTVVKQDKDEVVFVKGYYDFTEKP